MYGILSILFFIVAIILRDDKVVQVLFFIASGIFSIATGLSSLITILKEVINNKNISSQKKQ